MVTLKYGTIKAFIGGLHITIGYYYLLDIKHIFVRMFNLHI